MDDKETHKQKDRRTNNSDFDADDEYYTLNRVVGASFRMWQHDEMNVKSVSGEHKNENIGWHAGFHMQKYQFSKIKWRFSSFRR